MTESKTKNRTKSRPFDILHKDQKFNKISNNRKFPYKMLKKTCLDDKSIFFGYSTMFTINHFMSVC